VKRRATIADLVSEFLARMSGSAGAGSSVCFRLNIGLSRLNSILGQKIEIGRQNDFMFYSLRNRVELGGVSILGENIQPNCVGSIC